MEILNIKNLSFKYPSSTKFAIEDIDLSVKEGDFIVLFGETGCGKTTLLKMIKKELAPSGEISGEICYLGNNINDIRSTDIGFVMQKPEMQIVTDKVWHELAFGLENQGISNRAIYRRISEMASYFGIGDWFNRDISELSGGQKQLLNLASVMVTRPRMLILDEPTSQLDPIAASEFISTLVKLNRELSLTIIISEHRLEDLFTVADKAIYMSEGKIVAYDTPRNISKLMSKDDRMNLALPSSVRVYKETDTDSDCPLTVKEGRNFIAANFENTVCSVNNTEKYTDSSVLTFSHVSFRYSRDEADVIRDMSFSLNADEIHCILGDNAAGKSTALYLASGIKKPYSGKITVFGKRISEYKNGELYRNCVAMLPQDVQTVFLKDTVREDLSEITSDFSALPFDITEYLDKHPYDLSGGEQQLCALAKVLLLKPRILILDEPTKGIDASAKRNIITILKELSNKGVSILIVTHDVEFAASSSDRCSLLFNGSIVATEDPKTFFSENNFYTTAASRMSRGYYDNAVTVDDVVQLCNLNGKKRIDEK